jgi:hypothetical protein
MSQESQQHPYLHHSSNIHNSTFSLFKETSSWPKNFNNILASPQFPYIPNLQEYQQLIQCINPKSSKSSNPHYLENINTMLWDEWMLCYEGISEKHILKSSKTHYFFKHYYVIKNFARIKILNLTIDMQQCVHLNTN